MSSISRQQINRMMRFDIHYTLLKKSWGWQLKLTPRRKDTPEYQEYRRQRNE